MASYLDQLGEEPERLERALATLQAEQEAHIRRLRQLCDEYVAALDMQVLRLVMLQQKFGSAHGETQDAERRTEDASKPVTELRAVIARQQEILDLFAAYRDEFHQTRQLGSLSERAPQVPA